MKYPTHDATALLFEGKFTDGNPIAAVPPSPDRADYQNAVYDELLAVITAGGLTPNFANRAQVQASIAAQIAAAAQALQESIVLHVPPGASMGFRRKTAPDGWLEENGAAVPVANYAELAAAIWCGAADNATADWGYRCTDPEDASNTRSNAGAYIVLPDSRGEFDRGWDNGRGIDTGRGFYAWQEDMFKSHVHGLQSVGVDTSGGGGRVTGAGTNQQTGATGGHETRPRNIAILKCIKY